MSRITDAIRVLRGIEAKAEVPGAVYVVPPSLTRRTTALALDTVSHANECVNVARSFLATQASQTRLLAYDDGEPDPTHPFSVAFANPSGIGNDALTQTDVWRYIVRQLTGPTRVGAFLLIVPTVGGEIAAVWPRSDADVRPRFSTTDFVAGWEWNVDGRWRPMDENVKVVWLRQVGDKLHEHHSPLHDIQRAVKSDAEIAAFLDYMLENMGMGSGIIAIPGIDKSTAEQVTEFINEELMGAHNAGKKKVVPSEDIKQLDMGGGLKDFDLGGIRDRLELAVASAYGIPAEILQLLVTASKGEGLSGNAFREKRKIVYQNTIIPLTDMIEERVALTCAPMYGLGVEDIHFDYSRIDVLDNSPLEKAQTASAILAAVRTIATVDERRRIASENGIVLEQVSKPGTDDIPELVNRERLASLGMLADQGPREVKALLSIEERFARAAESVFAAERKRASKIASGKAYSPSASAEAFIRAMYDAVDEAAWQAAFDGLVRAVVAEAGSAVADGFGVTFGPSSPRAVAAAAQRVTQLAGQVTETTKQNIRDFVVAKLEEGSTLDELARDIASTGVGPWGTMTVESRSALIARTESHGARMQGGFEGAREVQDEVGAMLKVWSTALDDVVRDEHADMEGETVPLDEPFSNGLMYPSEPNCRCVLEYSVKE